MGFDSAEIPALNPRHKKSVLYRFGHSSRSDAYHGDGSDDVADCSGDDDGECNDVAVIDYGGGGGDDDGDGDMMMVSLLLIVIMMTVNVAFVDSDGDTVVGNGSDDDSDTATITDSRGEEGMMIVAFIDSGSDDSDDGWNDASISDT